MKYTLIEEKGQYALILRGESITQYAVVRGLDKDTGSWDWTCCCELEEYNVIAGQNNGISRILSASPGETLRAVERIENEQNEVQKKIHELEEADFQRKSEQYTGAIWSKLPQMKEVRFPEKMVFPNQYRHRRLAPYQPLKNCLMLLLMPTRMM